MLPVYGMLVLATLGVVWKNRDQTTSIECQEWNAEMNKIDHVWKTQIEESANVLSDIYSPLGEKLKKGISSMDLSGENKYSRLIKNSIGLKNNYAKLYNSQPKHCRRVADSSSSD